MQATKIFKTEIVERHTYEKNPQNATILGKSCISIGNDGTIKRTPWQSGILSGLDLHRSQIVGHSSSYVLAKGQDEQLRQLSSYPYSTVVGKSIVNPRQSSPIHSEHSTFVESNNLDQCFSSGRITVSDNISSFDETVNAYPSRYVTSEQISTPRSYLQFQSPDITTIRPQPLPSSPPPPPAAAHERMCDAEVRHPDGHLLPSRSLGPAPAPAPPGRLHPFLVTERMSDAEVWNSTVFPPSRTLAQASSPPSSSVATVSTSTARLAPVELRALAQTMTAQHAAKAAAAPAPAPRARVLPVTVSGGYSRSVGALVSPRPAAARCQPSYAYLPTARTVSYKQHEYC